MRWSAVFYHTIEFWTLIKDFFNMGLFCKVPWNPDGIPEVLFIWNKLSGTIKFFSLAFAVMYFILRHSLVFTFLPSFLFLLLHFPTQSRRFCLSFILCCYIIPGFGTNCSLPSFSLMLCLPQFWSGENEWKTRTCAACTSTFTETENVCFVQSWNWGQALKFS